MPCHSLCLAAGSQTSVVFQDLGVSQVTLDLVFLIFSVHVLTLQSQEHSHFKAFLHNVYIVGFCVFGWGFLGTLSVLAALTVRTYLGGPQSSLLCDRPGAVPPFPPHLQEIFPA